MLGLSGFSRRWKSAKRRPKGTPALGAQGLGSTGSKERSEELSRGCSRVALNPPTNLNYKLIVLIWWHLRSN